MQATEFLQEEHRWILRMLGCLETLVERARDNSTAGRPWISSTSSPNFADGQHQDKEEKVLMPRLLTRASISEETGIRELAKDHAGERRLMLSMHSNLLGAIHGEPLSLREFVRTSSDYVELHRKHMTNEEALLLPMAERLLTSSDDYEILEGFQGIESGGSIARIHLIKRIEHLWRRIVSRDEEKGGDLVEHSTPRDTKENLR